METVPGTTLARQYCGRCGHPIACHAQHRLTTFTISGQKSRTQHTCSVARCRCAEVLPLRALARAARLATATQPVSVGA